MSYVRDPGRALGYQMLFLPWVSKYLRVPKALETEANWVQALDRQQFTRIEQRWEQGRSCTEGRCSISQAGVDHSVWCVNVSRGQRSTLYVSPHMPFCLAFKTESLIGLELAK